MKNETVFDLIGVGFGPSNLSLAVRLAEAIWRDDADEVVALITHDPELIHQHVLIRTRPFALHVPHRRVPEQRTRHRRW